MSRSLSTRGCGKTFILEESIIYIGALGLRDCCALENSTAWRCPYLGVPHMVKASTVLCQYNL